MAAGGNPLNVDLGPGRLYVAPIDTADPTSPSAALPSAWVAIGYTEDGTSIETNITSQAVEVAEELDPIGYEQTARMTKVSFQMAEATARNLALALGAGLTVAAGAVTFHAPDAGSIVAVKIVWDSDETPTTAANRRHLFRKCTPSGTTSIARKKAPAKALIAVAFDCAKPDSSTSAWTAFSNASGQI
jgi:hypothetical protein